MTEGRIVWVRLCRCGRLDHREWWNTPDDEPNPAEWTFAECGGSRYELTETDLDELLGIVD